MEDIEFIYNKQERLTEYRTKNDKAFYIFVIAMIQVAIWNWNVYFWTMSSLAFGILGYGFIKIIRWRYEI